MRAIRTLLTGATAIALCLAPVSLGPLPIALGVDASDPVAVKLKVRRSAEGPPTARAHAMMAEESMPPDSEMPVGTSLRR